MMNEMMYGINTALPGNYRAAIYCRLSKDDDLQGESASIANQRAMIEQYCKSNGWEVVAIYQDDGFTGLNMERPDFKRMLQAIEKGVINLVVTKDLSRLGRNYLETGRMIEDYFPRHGVRYIAMSDGIDTLKENNDIAPFKNILNEFYSRDISKKVHASYYLKATKGQYTGTVAPFGYCKDPLCKNHLVIDPETAPIVRQIFAYALDGRGPNYIQHRLENEKVPCPTWWNRNRGLRNHFTKWEVADPENGKYVWDFTVIKDLLRNPVYTGAIASQKRDYRFKLGNIRDKKPNEWIIIEGMHEPIISQEDFDIVQQKIGSRQRPRSSGDYSLFAGLLKCGECSKALTIRKTNAKHPQDIYACSTFNKYGKHHCTQHRVEYDELYEQVLCKIREAAAAALRNDTAVLDRLSNTCQAEHDQVRDTLVRQVAKDEERLAALDRMVMKLYEDMVAGRISEQNFDLMMQKSQAEQAELNARVSEAKKRLDDQAILDEDNRRWRETIREYADIQQLDASILHRLIREIVVHEDIDADGTRRIRAEIHFNMKPLPEELPVPSEKSNTVANSAAIIDAAAGHTAEQLIRDEPLKIDKSQKAAC